MRIEPGHVAVITGGASGIGYGLGQVLGRRGGRIVLADIREDGLSEAVDALRREGIEASGHRVDVPNEDSVAELAAYTIDTYGRVDLVCNNAGLVSPAAPMWEQDSATWQRMIGVKLLGVIHGVRSFAPLLVAQGSGHILNTASSGGLAPLPDRTPYTATMHAVVGLTETLDLELKRVSPRLGATVLCPGLVDTPLGQNSAALGAITLPSGGGSQESMRAMAAVHGGILSPEDVAGAAVAAIEAGRVHVAPGGGVLDRARDRVARLLDDLEAAVAPVQPA
jgi:NAD(P)-dependent dehydrogenase (short-subunit alcohol dehydrogenase family)